VLDPQLGAAEDLRAADLDLDPAGVERGSG